MNMIALGFAFLKLLRRLIDFTANDDQIIAIHATSAVEEGHSALVVFAVKVSAQVFLWVFRCVHNSIVHNGIGNRAPRCSMQPAEKGRACVQIPAYRRLAVVFHRIVGVLFFGR